ncbi:MAG: hypothetical protein DHS20C18_54370 [Saprospiraceae bacterium]|nr:MAG: hypothetical protein DHS20C18_54370 [Saprospiraceae bacterium]
MKKPLHLLSILLVFSSGLSLAANADTLGLALQWEKLTFPALPQSLVVDQQDRPYLYVGAKSGGLRVWEDNGNELPEEVGAILPAQLEDLEVMNLHQEGNYLYLALGNFFGTNVQEAGMGIIDVSNPEAPQVVDVWKADTLVKGSAFVTIDGNYAYLGAMGMGLIVLDISQPEQIAWEATYQPDIHFPMENPGEVQHPNARGMAIQGDLLYLCYDAGGIRVIDITDPSQPFEVGRYINETLLGKQQAYNNVLLVGDLAYVAIDYCGLEILDISQPDNISQIGWWNPWNCETPDNLWLNSPGHTNQLAYDADHEQMFLSSGGSELKIVDVSDPGQPVLCSSYGDMDNQLGTWGLTLDKDRLFLGYINAFIPFFGTWSGIKLLALDQLNTATEEVPFVEPLERLSCSPNPFRESTQLQFTLPQTQTLLIRIYNAAGKVVWHQSKERFPAGTHSLSWNGKDRQGRKLPTGLYYFAVKVNGREYLQKLAKI